MRILILFALIFCSSVGYSHEPISDLTMELIRSYKPKTLAQIGLGSADQAHQLVKCLPKDSTIYLLDFEDETEAISKKLKQSAPQKIIALGHSYKWRDSYYSSLFKLLQTHSEPLFDYVHLDGMGSLEMDGFAFLLIDQLLKKGGFIDIEGYEGSLASSKKKNPKGSPAMSDLYTDEQLEERWVKQIVVCFIKRSKRYKEIVPHKIYQKVS